MHKMLVKHGYRHHPSGNIQQDYIHNSGVHLEVNPYSGGWRRAEYPDHEGGHGAQTLHDYLHGKYKQKIAAGGPGSGCRGPNCGRPSTGKADVLSRIPKSTIPLNAKERAVESKFRHQIAREPQLWKQMYQMKFGNVLNADNAKELSKDYRSDRSMAAAVHEPASWLIKQLWKDELAQTRPEKANVVFFTAGGAGSGKTSSIEGDPAAKAVLQKAQIVYDGTLRPAGKAIERIQQALDAGKEAAVMYVHRDPVEAFTDGILGRAARQEAIHGTGRTVPLSEFVAQHSSIDASMKQLYDRFKDNPKFSFGVIDNTGEAGKQKRTTLEQLPPSREYNELRSELEGKLDEAYSKGNISQKIYNAVKGTTKGRYKEVGI